MKSVAIVLLLICFAYAVRIPATNIKMISFKSHEITTADRGEVPEWLHVICMWKDLHAERDSTYVAENRMTCLHNADYLFLGPTSVMCDSNRDGVNQDSCVIVIKPSEEKGAFTKFMYDGVMNLLGGIPDHQIITYQSYEITVHHALQYVMNYAYVAYMDWSRFFKGYNAATNMVRSFIHVMAVNFGAPRGTDWVSNTLLNFILANEKPWYTMLARFALVSLGAFLILWLLVDAFTWAAKYMWRKFKNSVYFMYTMLRMFIVLSVLAMLYFAFQ